MRLPESHVPLPPSSHDAPADYQRLILLARPLSRPAPCFGRRPAFFSLPGCCPAAVRQAHGAEWTDIDRSAFAMVENSILSTGIPGARLAPFSANAKEAHHEYRHSE